MGYLVGLFLSEVSPFLLATLYLLEDLVGAVEAFAACVPYLLH